MCFDNQFLAGHEIRKHAAGDLRCCRGPESTPPSSRLDNKFLPVTLPSYLLPSHHRWKMLEEGLVYCWFEQVSWNKYCDEAVLSAHITYNYAELLVERGIFYGQITNLDFGRNWDMYHEFVTALWELQLDRDHNIGWSKQKTNLLNLIVFFSQQYKTIGWSTETHKQISTVAKTWYFNTKNYIGCMNTKLS